MVFSELLRKRTAESMAAPGDSQALARLEKCLAEYRDHTKNCETCRAWVRQFEEMRDEKVYCG
jgi:predicted RecB family nuclease